MTVDSLPANPKTGRYGVLADFADAILVHILRSDTQDPQRRGPVIEPDSSGRQTTKHQHEAVRFPRFPLCLLLHRNTTASSSGLSRSAWRAARTRAARSARRLEAAIGNALLGSGGRGMLAHLPCSQRVVRKG